ncbi:hypothetical protein PO124_20910 [Bacillus licheniformis]|nr:hypothetical protein [Bacillus licheniformis]
MKETTGSGFSLPASTTRTGRGKSYRHRLNLRSGIRMTKSFERCGSCRNGAKQSFKQDTNEPIVTIKLKDADKFGEVTKKVLDMKPNNQLVIWLDYKKATLLKGIAKADHKYISAPNVSQVLNTSDVMIEGNFTIQEAKDMASILNAGALPVKLVESIRHPSERSLGSRL